MSAIVYAVMSMHPLTSGLKLDPKEIQYLQAFSLEEIKQLIQKNSNEFATAFLAALDAFVSNSDKY